MRKTNLRMLLLGAALLLFAAAPAQAIVIDGDLSDLEAAIAANQGPSAGGDICTDATGEIGSAQCAYYVNGFDMERFLVLVDPLQNPDGSYTGEVDVYAGFDEVGLIGDVDGNGNPDTYTPGLSCATGDQTGIGPFESYVVDFDFDCDGSVDARFGVKGNQVINFFTLGAVPGGQFAYINDKLEVKIPNLKAASGLAFDICDMRIKGGSNAEFDQLAEDDCSPAFTVAFDPEVEVTKTPEVQNACPDAQVSWTITVTNTGPCNLDEVNVTDVLDVGMSYVSDNQGSTGDAQTRNWQFTNLAAGASIVINLTAQLASECAAPTMYNNVTVQALHDSGCREEPGTAGAQAQAAVNCSLPDCVITGDLEICEGASTELCGPDVAGLTYLWSTGATTRCITVDMAGTYTLTVTDQAGCENTCEATVTTVPCGTNCPRTVGFWGQQCAQKGNGSTKFTEAEVSQIAACIDDNSTAFDWSNDFAGFCANINPDRPMDCKKQAHRQFAALLANYCTGQLGLIASNGAEISLDPSTPNPCEGSFPDASNLGELIDDMDELLAQLDAENADPQDHRYCMISECSDGINNGRGIPIDPECAEDYMPPVMGANVGPLELHRARPNPFAETTLISYAVGEGAQVKIGIYNVAGRLVRTLVSGFQAAGQYQVSWDGRSDDGGSATRGVYFVRATVGGQPVAQSRVLYVR